MIFLDLSGLHLNQFCNNLFIPVKSNFQILLLNNNHDFSKGYLAMDIKPKKLWVKPCHRQLLNGHLRERQFQRWTLLPRELGNGILRFLFNKLYFRTLPLHLGQGVVTDQYSIKGLVRGSHKGALYHPTSQRTVAQL